MNISRFLNSRFALHAVLVAAVAGLGLDVYLKTSSGASICPTQACSIVSDYVRISDQLLVSAGLVFFALLWGVFFFASRYDRKWMWTICSMLIFGALAFDGGLLGFQFFSIRENCHLCIGVGVALIISLILYAMVRKKMAIMLLGLCVWIGGASAGAMINIPDRTPLLEQLKPITWSGPEAAQWPRFHYFFSLHCPHCTEVMINLAMNNPENHVWNLYPLDTAHADLRKITSIRDKSQDRETNLFYEIVRLEQSFQVPEVKVSKGLSEEIGLTRDFFRGSGFRGVPLMIVDEGQGRRVILTGGGNIISYLYEREILSQSR